MTNPLSVELAVELVIVFAFRVQEIVHPDCMHVNGNDGTRARGRSQFARVRCVVSTWPRHVNSRSQQSLSRNGASFCGDTPPHTTLRTMQCLENCLKPPSSGKDTAGGAPPDMSTALTTLSCLAT